MNIFPVTAQKVLDNVSRHCPEALSTYLQCLNMADKEGEIFFTKDKVEVDMSENWRPFCSNIKKLAREDLLEWHPFNNGISVTLADINE